MNMFLTYDVDLHQQTSSTVTKESTSLKEFKPMGKVERFFNRDQNFSITWFSTVKDYYNFYISQQVKILEAFAEKAKQQKE